VRPSLVPVLHTQRALKIARQQRPTLLYDGVCWPAQGAAEVGGAVDAEGRLLELSSAAPWRQALLKKLALSNDKKSNLQVRGISNSRGSAGGTGLRKHSVLEWVCVGGLVAALSVLRVCMCQHTLQQPTSLCAVVPLCFCLPLCLSLLFLCACTTPDP
jgi:hypothetical protein